MCVSLVCWLILFFNWNTLKQSHAFHSGGIFRLLFLLMDVCVSSVGVCYELKCMQIHPVLLFKPFLLVFICHSLQLPVLTTFCLLFFFLSLVFMRLKCMRFFFIFCNVCVCFFCLNWQKYTNISRKCLQYGNNSNDSIKQHHHQFKFERHILSNRQQTTANLLRKTEKTVQENSFVFSVSVTTPFFFSCCHRRRHYYCYFSVLL